MAGRLATVAEIRGLSPNLSSDDPGSPYPTTMLEVYSAIAARFIGIATWGEDSSYGHALLTAHLTASAVAGAVGPAGPLTSETIGGESRGFASTPNDDEFGSTSYGRMYLALRKVVTARAGTLIVANSSIDNGS